MKRIVLLFTLTIAFFISSASFAEIKKTMSYQGQLTNSDGIPINGTVNARFRFYTALAGGTQLWFEQHNDVPVNNGLFNVTLGASSSPAAHSIDLAMRENLFLELQVHNGSTWETMTPRHPLVAGAYALAARNVVHRQVLTVTQDGGDASTISEAIDMLLGQSPQFSGRALVPAPSADTPWVIEVKAGYFDEPGTYGATVGTIIVPDYVTIRGQGWNATRIKVGVVDMSGTKCGLESLKIEGEYDSVVVINLAGSTYSHVREVWSESSSPTSIVDLTGASHCQVMDNHLIGNGPMACGGIQMGGSQYCRIENNYIDMANDAYIVSSTTGSFCITDSGTATVQCTITKNTIRYVSSGVAGPGPSYGIGVSGTSSTTNSSSISHNVFQRGAIAKDIIAVGTGNYPTWDAPGTGAHGICNQGSDGTLLPAF